MKEPWQMTQIEWQRLGEQRQIRYDTLLKEQAKTSDQLDFSTPVGRELASKINEQLEAEGFSSKAGYGHKFIIQRALSEGKPVPPEVFKDYPDLQAKVTVKEPWQMTLEEYAYAEASKYGHGKPRMEWIRAGYGEAYRSHKTAVQRALKEGKPVPPEVLRDYPDLAKQAKVSPRQTQERSKTRSRY